MAGPRGAGAGGGAWWRHAASTTLGVAAALVVAHVLITLDDVLRGEPLADALLFGAIKLAVCALILWRVWCRGRITYVGVLPVFVLLAVPTMWAAQSDPAAFDHTAAEPAPLFVLRLLTFVAGMLLCYAPSVRRHVLARPPAGPPASHLAGPSGPASATPKRRGLVVQKGELQTIALWIGGGLASVLIKVVIDALR